MKRDLRAILAHILNRDEKTLFLEDIVLSLAQKEEVDRLLKRVEGGEPLAYVLGKVSFYGCMLKITKDVLIPRLETELLAERVVHAIDPSMKGSLLDLCTGSGALGLSIKKHRPNMKVTLSDISTGALDVAKENARANGLEVEVTQGDLFDPLKGRAFDYIVSNPPYVSEKEYGELEGSVKDFEPKIALVGGEGGYAFYRRIAEEGGGMLNRGGALFLEIGATQGEVIKKIFTINGWKNLRVDRDLSGHDRFFFASNS